MRLLGFILTFSAFAVSPFGKLFRNGKLLTFQSATLIINKYEMSHNGDLMTDIRIDIKNIKAGSLVNIQFKLLQDVAKMIIYGRFNIPESSGDREYKKEVLQSVIDVDRLFRGVGTNFISKSVIEEFGKTMNFERKFPIKKVSNCQKS